MFSAEAKTEIQRFNALSVHSIRYGREIGSLMLIYLVGICYASTSPIILPFALFYCVAAWVFWRYNMLYVSERCYESGGRIWELTFRCVIWILFIAELFTGQFQILCSHHCCSNINLDLNITLLLVPDCMECMMSWKSILLQISHKARGQRNITALKSWR